MQSPKYEASMLQDLARDKSGQWRLLRMLPADLLSETTRDDPNAVMASLCARGMRGRRGQC